ncbi:MAG: TetR/AcrR family transcriptional regulator [Clostridia bacterium]
MKAGLTKKTIVETAARMADTKGLAHVTLKELAAELGVKSPSLYKHIPGGLSEIYEELMVYGWRCVDNDLARAAAGKAKDDAIRAICRAFRDFAIQHPGVFEVLQWHNSYTSDRNKEATKGIIATLNQILEAYHMTEDQKLHILRFLRGFVQGFATIEAHGGFGDPVSVDESFDFAVTVIINGIHDLREAQYEG